MTHSLNRRGFTVAALAATLGYALSARAQAPTTPQPTAPGASSAHAHAAFVALEAKHGGRLGVVALDTGSGRTIGYRGGERFAMCSTHKFLTVAAVLTMVDQGRMKLDKYVRYSRSDLLEYAPITGKNVDTGFMTVDALCTAAIEWSDNTAENLLLGLIDGPVGWTRYARSIGDTVSRLDRIEPALNTAIPDDPRDTTTPDAMVHNLNVVLLGGTLSSASRARLENWMLDSKINGSLLHGGLPKGWRVADKSGSGESGTRNDIGIILPPATPPILAAAYYTGSTEPRSFRERVIAETGRIIAGAFGA